MKVAGIDPGTNESALVVLDWPSKEVCENRTEDNHLILDSLAYVEADHLAIEMVASYGMPVGATTFETVVWIGRFIERWGGKYTKVYRKQRKEVEGVAMHLCKSSKANDATIRQAILDMYSPSGGGKTPQVGTKKEPGPLYGISGHQWQALAVAITYAESSCDGLRNDARGLRGVPEGAGINDMPF